MTAEVDLLNLLESYSCINQSLLVEYLFLADRKHKDLQKAIHSKEKFLI
jgi:hypothetical protein